MARAGKKTQWKGNGAPIVFEAKLWPAVAKSRNDTDTAEYKPAVLGLIFLKYISAAFSELHAKLTTEPGADPRCAPGLGA
jgi:type I restriction enzyme M protein